MTMTKETQNADIQRRVVAMYEKHPFPSYTDKFRKASEELYLKMRLLGIPEEGYTGKKILDCGCGTGEFTCWYVSQGNEMTAIDLSAPSIAHAKAYAEEYDLADRIDFKQMSVLEIDLPENHFDIVYSYGVIHHTPDPVRAYANMVKACKPGGIVTVSVYSLYSRWILRMKQKLINAIAGDDVEKRMKWGKRLFPFTARKLKKRAHDDSDAILYDQFAIPHESLHTVGEVLGWLDSHDLEYVGAFGPLRLRDYLYAACLPEYARLEPTFDGYFLTRMASRMLKGMSRLAGFKPEENRVYKRPGPLSRWLVQMGWFFLGLRFSCFSISARKPVRKD